MPTISSNQARALFTSNLIGVFDDYIEPSGFLRSFFPSRQEFTKELSIQVRRNSENVAVDVLRGTEGNRNKFDKSTEKVVEPPYYREYYDMTSLTLYDRLFGSTAIDAGVMTALTAEATRNITELRAKIERAKEIQCAQVLLLGTATFVNADSVNFRRKAASLVDLDSTTGYWTDNTVDPFATMATGATFLRTIGKANDDTFNVIMGSAAFAALQANTIYKGRVNQNLNNNIDSVNPPQRNSTGAAYQGTVSTGSWKAHIWTYPQFYDVSGTATPYIDPKKIVMIPSNPSFVFGHAAVPQIFGMANNFATQIGNNPMSAKEYVISDYVDARLDAHIMDIKSAGLAIPIAVDRIYTAQVTA